VADSRAIVGVDIGTSGVRGVQLKGRPGSYSVHRAAAVPLPRDAIRNGNVADAPAVTTALRRLWRSGGFSTHRAAFGLADSGVLTRQLDLPWMPPEDFRSALRYQVTDALPVDVRSVELDYHLLAEFEGTDDRGRATPMNRILVVAADRAAVVHEATVVRKGRFEPVVADSTALALIRAACHGVLPDDSALHALVDVGAHHLTVVLHQGGQPRFVRTVASLGGETATEAVAERLDLDLDEAEALKRVTGLNGPPRLVASVAESSVFAVGQSGDGMPPDPRTALVMETLGSWASGITAEVRNSLDYFAASTPGTAVTDLTLNGRTFLLSGLEDRFATQFRLPVRRLGHLAGLPASDRVMRAGLESESLGVAIGLAMSVTP
jgi:type IV pilus assembly protein PilM